MKRLTKTIMICITIILFSALLSITPLTYLTNYKIHESRISCDGIENFITGDGIQSDINMIKRWYSFCYDVQNNSKIYTPQKLYNCEKKFDCKSYAHTLRCLTDNYNVSHQCDFYVEYGGDNPISPDHIAYKCKIDDQYLRF